MVDSQTRLRYIWSMSVPHSLRAAVRGLNGSTTTTLVCLLLDEAYKPMKMTVVEVQSLFVSYGLAVMLPAVSHQKHIRWSFVDQELRELTSMMICTRGEMGGQSVG
jgi:hypothetical protein